LIKFFKWVARGFRKKARPLTPLEHIDLMMEAMDRISRVPKSAEGIPESGIAFQRRWEAKNAKKD